MPLLRQLLSLASINQNVFVCKLKSTKMNKKVFFVLLLSVVHVALLLYTVHQSSLGNPIRSHFC